MLSSMGAFSLVNIMSATAVKPVTRSTSPVNEISCDTTSFKLFADHVDHSLPCTLAIFSLVPITPNVEKNGFKTLIPKLDNTVKTLSYDTDSAHHGILSPRHHLLDRTMSYTDIFNQIDSTKPSGSRDKSTNFLRKTQNKTQLLSSTDNPCHERDSGYQSSFGDVTSSSLSWSPHSAIFQMLDRDLPGNKTQLNQIGDVRVGDFSISLDKNMSSPKSNIVDQQHSNCCDTSFGASPFTCAQRTCKGLTFGYLTPLRTQSSNNRQVEITQLMRMFDPKSLNQTDSDDDHNTTLDILNSLDSSPTLEETTSQSISQMLVCETLTEKRKALKPKLPAERSKNLSSVPDLKIISETQKLHTTPNKRNAKRCLGPVGLQADILTPRSKITRSNSDPQTTVCMDNTIAPTTNKPKKTVFPNTSDLTDFIGKVTYGNYTDDTHPLTLTTPGLKYQHVTHSDHETQKQESHFLSKQDIEDNEEIPYFLLDKSKQDRDDWYTGRRAMAYSTRQTVRRSYLRQAYNHGLLTEWATRHEGLPPWLQTDELHTTVFEVKAKAGCDITRHCLEYLDSDVKEHNQTSAASLAKIEGKLTPSELTASRASLKEHMDYIADPIKKSLADKREYLRRNQPSVSDLVTMRNRERNFPKKSNPPPQKKRPASAAQGRLPTKKQPNAENQPPQFGDQHATNQGDRYDDQERPYRDSNRGGGYHHYRGNRNRDRQYNANQDFNQQRRDQGDTRQPNATSETGNRKDGNPPRRGDKKRGQNRSRRPRRR